MGIVRQKGKTESPYANIIHHHLVEAAWAEGALDDICDRLGGQN